MTRHCRICGKDMESPDDAEKKYLYDSCLCSRECQNKYKNNRRNKEGHCSNCGKKLPPDYEYEMCENCRERKKEYITKIYERRKKENKCVDCGEKLPDDWNNLKCPECREKRREKNKEWYERCKRENKCPECGRDLSDIFGWDSILCPECLEKQRNKDFYGIHATDDEIRLGIY